MTGHQTRRWIGPDGVNPLVGSVFAGKEVTITDETAERLEAEGLIEREPPAKKQSKKEV